MQTFDIIKHYKHIKQIGHLIQPQQTQNLCFKAGKKTQSSCSETKN